MPEKPAKNERKAAAQLINGIATLYPCNDCREDFQQSVKAHPPESRTSTRADFALYVCEQHNIVNRKLGKEEVKCDIEALDRMWRKTQI
ncbi:hypothetical protein TrRE_jg1445 [Triparma retinervis]|uniref:Sulfhydryl oxidase n=1 Tax=Triparma retinervis TaxID=2557542 RepID=A0A9W7E2I0_9STRA|nr:hypothetical protein TrRE_jg1445 [Triparma retinervis]